MLSSGTSTDTSTNKSKGGFLRWMSMTALVGAVLMGTARKSQAADVQVSNNTDVVNGDTSSVANLIATPGVDGISLREAIIASNNTAGANSIDFAPAVTGSITLDPYSGLSITDETTITGADAATLAIRGGGNSRVITAPAFYVQGPPVYGYDYYGNPYVLYFMPGSYERRPVTISGLTIGDGNATDGGGVFVGFSRTVTLNNCVVTGCNASNSGGAVFVDDQSFYYSSYDTQLNINGSTISNNTAGYYGGAIRANNDSNNTIVSLYNSTVSGNSSGDRGGGIFLSSGVTLYVENSTLTNNSSNQNGGAIFAGYNVAIDITDSTVSGNSGRRGGAISLYDANSASISDSTFDSNTALYGGGAIDSARTDLYIGSSTFTNNAVDPNSNSDGGALYFRQGDLFIRRSTISGNRAPTDGGGVYMGSYSNAYVYESTIDNNTTGRTGGGIAINNSSSYLRLNQSTVSGNRSASYGGGVATRSYSRFLSSTIANNSGQNGGGISLYGSYNTVQLYSTIVSGNTNEDMFRRYPGSINAYNSLITTFGYYGLTGGANNQIGVSANLTPLTNLGGPTRTHGLLAGSPALDNGTNPTSATFDQRGNPFARSIAPQTDIGATEGIITGPFVAAVNAPTVNGLSNPTQYDFTITFQDDLGINVATLTSNAVRVTGPGAFNSLATFVAVDVNTNGSPRVATFRITPPGGTWNTADNGTYTISIEPNQIADTSGNFVFAGQAATFQVAIGQTFVVTNLLDNGPGSLRDALYQANYNNNDPLQDAITFSVGLTGTINLYSELYTGEGVIIAGPGASIITVSGGGSNRHLYLRADPNPVSISGLTFADGYTSGYGGSIYGRYENLTISNCTFSNNEAYNTGGAFFFRNGTLTLESCTFSGNTTNRRGGVLYADGTDTTIRNSTFSGNSSGSSGGALYFYDATVLIERSVFSNNASNNDGGAIAFDDTTVTVRESTFSGNSSNNDGGAIYLDYGSRLRVENSTFFQNSTYDGGAIQADRGTNVDIIQSTFNQNYAYRGGAIYFESGNHTIRNSTIAGNSAFNTGGILADGSYYYYAFVDVRSTIISGNGSQDIRSSYARLYAFNSLIQTGFYAISYGSNNIYGQDPLLRPLANVGGPTMAMGLRSGSPALDAGSNPLSLTTDQRGTGFARVLNGQADIGAVEGVVPNPFVVLTSAPTVDGSSNPTQYDFTITIDDDIGVDVSSLATGNIRVTGPSGFNVLATFVSVDVNTNGTPRVATFRITPPGGTWDMADTGVYTIAVEANQIKDTDGNFAFAGSLGQFNVGFGQSFIVKNLNDSGLYSLRDCLQQANNNGNGAIKDTITFQSGLTGTITLTSGQLYAYESVNITGPGAAVITVDAADNSRILFVRDSDLGLSGLTLTGGNDLYNDGSALKTEDATITLDGLTFTGNNAGSDGALAVERTTGTVSNTTFSNNTANDSGAGAWLYDNSSITFDTCVFSGNSAGSGGAIYMYNNSTLTLNNCTFSGNTAYEGGGALYATDSSVVTITDSSFSGNSCLYYGGAIYLRNSQATITGSTISGNTAGGAGGGAGGGVGAFYGSTLSLSTCIIDGNTANSGGGGKIDSYSDLTASDTTFDGNSTTGAWGGALYLGTYISGHTIQRCTFSNNTTTDGGGAIEIYQSLVTIESSTFANNSADGNGGALYIGDSTVTIRNSTIAGNVADADGAGGELGGGVRVGTYNNSPVTLNSTIISGNQRGAVATRVSDDVSDPDNDTVATSDHNLIGNGTGQTILVNGANGNIVGTAAAPIDAKLGTLADNGGPTETMLILPGSPAIDAGSNPANLTVDQRNLTRVIGSTIDIGAVEFDGVPPTVTMGTAPDVTLGSVLTDYTFTIVFSDNQGMLPTTMDNDDILVTGPNGFSQLAQFVSLDNTTAGSPRIATYRITPPGGTWDPTDDGVYTITMVAGQVTDAQGNPVTGGVIGTFTVRVGAGGGGPLGPLDPNGDIDGDGFTNGWEQALGSDPRNPNSRPFGLPRPFTGGPMKVRQLLVALDFSGANRDRIRIKGTLPLKNTAFTLAGQVVIIDVGGVVKAFTLGADGTATSGSDTIKVKLGKKKGGQFSVELLNGSFANSFVDEGLVPTQTSRKPRLVQATLLLNNLYYQAIVKKPFNVKKGQFGR